MLDIDTVRRWDFGSLTQTYSERDTMLYALAVGFGENPSNQADLAFVFEKNLKAVPSMASILCSPGGWYGDPRTGIDVSKVVHGEQDITILRPLPASGSLTAHARVTAIVDKGPGKGAILEIQRDLIDSDGSAVARIRHIAFCRAEGACYGNRPQTDRIEPLPSAPERTPDFVVDMPTLPQSALIYRLLGDYNPLHADPAYAKGAGYDRPILHGLCVFGMATRAVLTTFCGHDAHRVKRMSARFSAPTFPGEVLQVRMWREATDVVQLQVTVPERGVTVLANGRFEIAPI